MSKTDRASSYQKCRSESSEFRTRANSEHVVAAVDDQAVAGVIAGRIGGEVDGDAAEVLRPTPAARRHAADDAGVEHLRALRALGHLGGDPAGQDGVGADA